ncbi:DegT/DnrJ/EryC1/StrS family aminotransferase [bacterium]|nr:DegT/DnrJ/EryC1/StrS family aminotransferase [bacterium]
MEKKLALDRGKPVRKEFLPFCRPLIGQEEIDEVVDTLRGDWITTGPKTKQFEKEFAGYIGSRFALAVNSATAGLTLSLAAVGVGPGDEVITTPMTFAACANEIIHRGARPVFVDIEEDTYNIDPAEIKKHITPRTKAILVVHFAGHPAQMEEISRIAGEHNLKIIEDAAHATESVYHGQKIGTISDVTVFSFYATKNLTTGEGGMVTTNDPDLFEKMSILSLHGMSRDAYKRYSEEGAAHYEVVCPGFKCNLSDIQSSIGLHQLRKIARLHKRREAIWKKYNQAFGQIEELKLPTERPNILHAYHLYSVLLKSIDRDWFIEALKAEGIGASIHFISLHLHPYYRKTFGFKKEDFKVASYVSGRILSLPLYPKMTDEDVEDVLCAVKKIVAHKMT